MVNIWEAWPELEGTVPELAPPASGEQGLSNEDWVKSWGPG